MQQLGTIITEGGVFNYPKAKDISLQELETITKRESSTGSETGNISLKEQMNEQLKSLEYCPLLK